MSVVFDDYNSCKKNDECVKTVVKYKLLAYFPQRIVSVRSNIILLYCTIYNLFNHSIGNYTERERL